MMHWEYAIYIYPYIFTIVQLPLLAVQESDTTSCPSLWKCHSLIPAQQLQCTISSGDTLALVQTDILNIHFWNFLFTSRANLCLFVIIYRASQGFLVLKHNAFVPQKQSLSELSQSTENVVITWRPKKELAFPESLPNKFPDGWAQLFTRLQGMLR